MSRSDLVLSIAAFGGVGITLLGMVCVLLVSCRSRRLSTALPAITIYKPLKGTEEGLEENLRSFFELDYPVFQLLFGVVDPDDTAIPLVRRLCAEFPAIDASLVVHDTRSGLNPKVQNMLGLESHRRHEVVLISDSNVRVRPSYLRDTVAYLSDDRVGLVTNLFTGVGEKHFGAALENIQLNGVVAAGMAIAATFKVTCVVGKSMLMPARVLHEVGGLFGVRNLLAEDQVLGLRIRKAGYEIRVSHHVIQNVNVSRDLRWFLNRHSRWFKMRYRLARVPFLLEPLSNLSAMGLVWALSGDTGLAWGGLVALTLLATFRDHCQAYCLRGKLPALRHLWLSPVKDLFLVPLWFDALVNRQIHWRGHDLTIGPLTRLHREIAPRRVRDRLRRIRRSRS